MPTALVLGGTSAHIPLLQQLRQRGWQTLLLDYHARPVAAPYTDRHLRQSALDLMAVCEAARAHRAELVVKPVDSCGSRGVRRVTQTQALPAALQAALNISRAGAALIECFRSVRPLPQALPAGLEAYLPLCGQLTRTRPVLWDFCCAPSQLLWQWALRGNSCRI